MTQTASGAIATFRSPGRVPINSLKAYFAPVQEGEGTPALDNVRPITGWTGIETYIGGANLCDTQTGEFQTTTNSYIYFFRNKVLPAGTYHVYIYQHPDDEGFSKGLYVKRGSESARRIDQNWSTVFENVYRSFSVNGSESINLYLYGTNLPNSNGFRIVLSRVERSLSEPFVPYKSFDTLPVSWESSGSLYGGYVDLITGEVWQTWDSDILDGSKTIKVASSNRWQIVYPDGTFHYVRTSSAYIKSDKLSPLAASSTGGTKKYIIAIGGARYLFLQLDSDVYTTVEEVEAWLEENKPQIVYEKATPQLVTTLTPTQLRSIIGSNSIWSDAGDVEVNYDYAEPVEMLRIRERAASAPVANINQWDEQWEVGQFNSNGATATGSNQIRTANLIPVLPNTEYYIYSGKNINCRVYFLKEDGSVISYTAYRNTTFTTPTNCYFIKFHTGIGYGETYGYDISINYPSTDHDYHKHV